MAVTFERSTFRSLASFRIGGLAITSVDTAEGSSELALGIAAAIAAAATAPAFFLLVEPCPVEP